MGFCFQIRLGISVCTRLAAFFFRFRVTAALLCTLVKLGLPQPRACWISMYAESYTRSAELYRKKYQGSEKETG